MSRAAKREGGKRFSETHNPSKPLPTHGATLAQSPTPPHTLSLPTRPDLPTEILADPSSKQSTTFLLWVTRFLLTSHVKAVFASPTD